MKNIITISLFGCLCFSWNNSYAEQPSLPMLEVPEAKNLNDNEKEVINSVVDSVFAMDESEEETAEKPKNTVKDEDAPSEKKEELGNGETPNEVTERSILDSKQEVASRVDEESNEGKESEKIQKLENTEEKDEEASPTEGGKELIVTETDKTKEIDKQEETEEEKNSKVYDTTKLFLEDVEKEKTNEPSYYYPEVNKIDKPIFIPSKAEKVNFQPVSTDKKSVISISDEDFYSDFNDESAYKALQKIKLLPTRSKKVEIKEEIKIERGDFKDPFYDEVDTAGEEVKEEDNYDDFDLSSIENKEPLDISEVKTTSKTAKEKDAKKKPKKFHLREKDLKVEIKSISNKKSLRLMHDARDALMVGQYESAITYYKEMLKDNPKDKKITFGLATAYHKAKQFEHAKRYYLEAIKLDGEYWAAVNNYIILVSEESPENAESKLIELWQKNPDFASIPAQIANLNYKEGNYEKAAELYSKAIKLDPKNYSYLYNLARILEKMGNRLAAAKIYREIIETPMADSKLPESKISIQKRFYKLLSKG